jgi:hypothetical protein
MTWLIVVVAIVVVVAAAAVAYKWQRTAALRQRFGPEYDRVLEQEGGDQRRADAALRHRAKRRAALEVRDLTPDAHTRFGERWHALQGHFVDDPRGAVTEAAQLVRSVIHERGYRADDPDLAIDPGTPVHDVLDLVAVDHGEAVAGYRGGDEIAANRSASTEQLRQAFQGYKALFVAVLVKGEDAAADDADDTTGSTGATAPPVFRADDDADRRVIDVRRPPVDDTESEDGASGEDGRGGGLLGRFRRQPTGADPQVR